MRLVFRVRRQAIRGREMESYTRASVAEFRSARADVETRQSATKARKERERPLRIFMRGLPCETPSRGVSSLFDGFPTRLAAPTFRRTRETRANEGTEAAKARNCSFLARNLPREEPWEFKLFSYRDNLQLSTSPGALGLVF